MLHSFFQARCDDRCTGSPPTHPPTKTNPPSPAVQPGQPAHSCIVSSTVVHVFVLQLSQSLPPGAAVGVAVTRHGTAQQLQG